jgi:hypothetical protein
MAKKVLDIDVIGSQRDGDGYEVHPEKPTVTITAQWQINRTTCFDHTWCAGKHRSDRGRVRAKEYR